MKLVLRTLIFHLISIIAFAYIYLYLSDHFQINNEERNKQYTPIWIIFY